MLRAIVLGAAAGGGVPQWNCNCANCNAARTQPGLSRTQASLALSCDDEHWFLINASPDIRQQINATPELHPRGDRPRHSPIAGVFLTNGEIDAVAGLLTLREGWPFSIHAHPRILSVLQENTLFQVLNPDTVPRKPMALEAPFEPDLPDGASSGLEVTAFAAPGKPAWYLEEAGEAESDVGDTVGLHIRARDGGELVFLAACAEVTPELRERLNDAPLLFLDGTVWRDDEMAAAGLGHKTGRQMGHIAMSGEEGALRKLEGLGAGQKVFLHINNSNPALLPESPERREVEAAGWRIAHDGMEFTV